VSFVLGVVIETAWGLRRHDAGANNRPFTIAQAAARRQSKSADKRFGPGKPHWPESLKAGRFRRRDAMIDGVFRKPLSGRFRFRPPLPLEFDCQSSFGRVG
jgi:hypothetical protein